MNRRQLATTAAAGGAALALSMISRPALAADLGPVLAVISHPVKDFAAWKVVYDAAGPVRDQAGVTGAEVFTDAADPLMVVVLHHFPSVEAANAFLGNPDLAAAMEQGGVTAKPTVVLAVAA
jgi:quinol monooxygenase YgiN